jgi:hypothetical protein
VAVSGIYCGSSDIDGMIIVIVVKDDDPVQLRMEDIYDHALSAPYSTTCTIFLTGRMH